MGIPAGMFKFISENSLLSRFWGDLDTCERAVDDLKRRLDAIEPCVGQPEVIQAQTGERRR